MRSIKSIFSALWFILAIVVFAYTPMYKNIPYEYLRYIDLLEKVFPTVDFPTTYNLAVAAISFFILTVSVILYPQD